MLAASIDDAAERLAEVVVRTPLALADKLSAELGNQIYLKREDLQPVNSFKIRGAYNKIAQLTEEERRQGLVAVSAGNHAQGVALSARMFGCEAMIVMPKTTPDVKIDAVRSYGASVVLAGDNYSEAYDYYHDNLETSGLTFIHPYDDEQIIAGQGTVGKEISEQLPDASTVLVPIGGGGLISGVASYLKCKNPSIRIIGVQSSESDAMKRSLAAGHLVSLKHVGTFSDGTAVKKPGMLTLALVSQYVDEIISVDVEQQTRAISDVYNEVRVVLEPAGALAIAGARKLVVRDNLTNQKLVTIASGANISLDKLGFVAEQARLASGKEALFSISLSEKPGALRTFCKAVVSGHNISEFSYRLSGRVDARIFIGFKMAGASDKQHFKDKLAANNYKFTDFSHDDFAQRHLRHMIGGTNNEAKNERIYEVQFPERAGALADFLAAAGDEINISLFHFRGQGDDTSRVVIGFETADPKKLERRLAKAEYEFSRMNSPSIKQFL